MPPAPASPWARRTLAGLAAVCLLGLFSTEIADPDFWWHLKTGQYIVERRALPVPDPFSYTTGTGKPAYPGEERVRYFNLTHEWLAQLLWYSVYRAGGFAAVVLFKALMLAAFCALSGLVAARRAASFWWGLAATGATASVARLFSSDRPALVTFLLVAVFIWILERGRWLGLLPALSLVWANAHGGFFLGWLVLAAYTVSDRKLWRVSLAAIAVSGVNPNTFHVVEVLLAYRQSFLTQTLIEWSRPPLWGPPYVHSLLLLGAAAAMALAWRRVRLCDWLLFAAFAAASLAAFRNLPLIGFLAPVLIAAYLPWRWPAPRVATPAAALALLTTLGAGIASGRFFQLRAAEWKLPAGAADFLLARRVSAPLFNTYEYGGYLLWRLWPEQRVFIDGRALNESVYRDYVQALGSSGASAEESRRARSRVFDRYGVGAVVANAFEYTSGTLYPLVAALADPADPHWKLVYEDAQALVFLKDLPPGVAALDKSRLVAAHLEAECRNTIEHDPELSLCARTLGFLFLRAGDAARSRAMLALYLAHLPAPDPEADAAYRRLLGR